MSVLRRIKGQRRPRSPGETFVMQLDSDGSYRAGRVVKTRSPDVPRFPADALVYLYDIRLELPDVDTGELAVDRLLMPPAFVNSWMWHKGYFHTIREDPLAPAQLLARHCFYSTIDGYVDENDNALTERTEPCGWFSFATFEFLEREIAAALAGSPIRAPEPDPATTLYRRNR